MCTRLAARQDEGRQGIDTRGVSAVKVYGGGMCTSDAPRRILKIS